MPKLNFVDWLHQQDESTDVDAGKLARFLFPRLASGSMFLTGRGTKAVNVAIFTYRRDSLEAGKTREYMRADEAFTLLKTVKETYRACTE